MDNYHITKDGDKWKLQKEGNERHSKIADTKAEIINEMRDRIQNHVLNGVSSKHYDRYDYLR